MKKQNVTGWITFLRVSWSWDQRRGTIKMKGTSTAGYGLQRSEAKVHRCGLQTLVQSTSPSIANAGWCSSCYRVERAELFIIDEKTTKQKERTETCTFVTGYSVSDSTCITSINLAYSYSIHLLVYTFCPFSWWLTTIFNLYWLLGSQIN